jgi:adenylate cyclase
MHGQLGLTFKPLGPLTLKNIARPIEAFLVNLGARVRRPAARQRASSATRVRDVEARKPAEDVAAAIDADFHGRPAIAVLPFTTSGGGDDQAYFANGIADDIINELASWRTFPVIARGSSFAFKGERIDVARIGKQLGARYVVDGSLTRTGGRVRISARLTDTVTGVRLAAERFDRSIEELAELQDQIAAMIVGSIAPEVLRAERQRAIIGPRKNASSYEHFLRGLEAHYRYTKSDNAEAQGHFRKSIQLDPRNAQAYALLASAMIHAVQLGWREDEEHNYAVADQLASRAVALDPRAPFAHFSLGSTSMFMGRVDQALTEMRNAVRINPSHAAAYVIMAHLLCYVGQPDDALAAADRALRLSPYDPRLGLWLSAVSQAKYFLKGYEEAASVGRQALSLIPENLLAQRFAAASLGQLGRSAEAGSIITALRQSTAPSVEAVRQSVAHLYREPHMVEHMLDGLRKAGLD